MEPPVAITPVEPERPIAIKPIEPKPPVEPPIAITPVEPKPPVEPIAPTPSVDSKPTVEEPIALEPPIAALPPAPPPAIEPQRPPIEQPPTYTIPPENDIEPPVEIISMPPTVDRTFVGIIDTGFAAKNPDLDYSKVTMGRDRIDKDSNPLLNAGEGNEHGTFSWGLVSAIGGNDKGIDGYNDGANIYLSRAIGSGEWDLALTDFVAEAKAQKKQNAIALLPLDLTQKNADGSITTRYEFTPRERAALENARQNGVLLVVAAGNDGGVMSVLGQSSQEFENIITVGSSDGFGRSDYSSYGYGLDILVPGGAIDNPTLSTVGDDVGQMAGTSASAAIAAGMASKVWESNPALNPTQVIDILTGSAIDLNAPGWDEETGFGVVNLNKAVELAKEIAPQAYIPTPFLNPTTWGLEGQVTPLERATADEFNGKWYDWEPRTLQWGDTLSQIALETMGDASADAYNWIAQYNGIPNASEIQAGATIQVPKQVAAPVDPGPSDPGPSDPDPIVDPGSSDPDPIVDPGPSDPDPIVDPIVDPGPSNPDPIVDPAPSDPNSINLNGHTVGGNFYPVFQNYQGTLGNPVSDVIPYSGDVSYQLFDNGSIVSSANGTFPLYGGIRQAFLNTGGLEGWLGAPKSEEKGLGNGNIIQYFENGYIYWNGSKATAYETSTVNPNITPPSSTPKPGNLINGLPSSAAQATSFFKLQFQHPTYNPNGPSGSNNCGPTSLAIIRKMLGLEQPGITIETSIDHARYLMNPNHPSVSTREGIKILDLDRDQNYYQESWTSGEQIETGIKNSGGNYEYGSDWNTLNQKLSEGKPVIANGYYGESWRQQFPNYSSTGNGNVEHLNAILGRTSDGNYIVADPMYRGGPVEMTKEQLDVYFNGLQGVVFIAYSQP